MNTVKSYLSLIKFSHTIFAMPFALIGFFLSFYQPVIGYTTIPGWDTIFVEGKETVVAFPVSWQQMIYRFVLVILCMVFARSAAMAFNRYLDRKWDALNPRTAIREIPKGIITPKMP